jgi:hypothetical protein
MARKENEEPKDNDQNDSPEEQLSPEAQEKIAALRSSGKMEAFRVTLSIKGKEHIIHSVSVRGAKHVMTEAATKKGSNGDTVMLTPQQAMQLRADGYTVKAD